MWQSPQLLNQHLAKSHGALEERLGVVDGADSSGQGWRSSTEAVVHPGPIAHTLQLALHLPSQVAVGPVVQRLHAVGHLCCLYGLLVFRSDRKVKQAH